MRILYCNYEYPPLGGGGGVFNKQIAEELAKRHDVEILTSRGMGLPTKRVENGVVVHRVPVVYRGKQSAASLVSMLAYLPSGYLTGLGLIKDRKFDIVNTHFAVPSGPLGQWLSTKAGIPNVLSVHGGDLYDPSKFMSPHKHAVLRSIVRNVITNADAVVAQSNNTLENVHKYYDNSIDCKCIPLGIVRLEKVVAPRERYGLTQNDIVLVTVGRLVARKGLDQLLNILKQIDDKTVHLFVIGSGPQLSALQKQTGELGIDKRIHFLGQVDEEEKIGVLNMSDIYVSTSQHEGFGIVFLEAMAAGLPVLCYNHGGQTDFLVSGKNGELLELNDAEGFLQSCQKYIDNKKLRREIGAHNIVAVEDFYIDNCARRYEALYDYLIDAN